MTSQGSLLLADRSRPRSDHPADVAGTRPCSYRVATRSKVVEYLTLHTLTADLKHLELVAKHVLVLFS